MTVENIKTAVNISIPSMVLWEIQKYERLIDKTETLLWLANYRREKKKNSV